MGEIAIVTDSTAVIESGLLEKYPFLYTLPLQIIFKDDIYYDGEISQEKFFNLINIYPELPSTSQPLAGSTRDLFLKLLEKYQTIIYITISSNISGTYQTGAAISNDLDPQRIRVFDSLLTATVQKRMVMEACKYVEHEKSSDDIINCLSDMRNKHHTYLVVDDLKFLERTGRISGAVASVGSVLQIKPIVRFDNGLIVMDTKVRTINKSMDYLLRKLDQLKISDNTHILIAHAKGYEYALKMESLINEKYPNCKTSISELSPVISVHTGPQSMGISWVNGY